MTTTHSQDHRQSASLHYLLSLRGNTFKPVLSILRFRLQNMNIEIVLPQNRPQTPYLSCPKAWFSNQKSNSSTNYLLKLQKPSVLFNNKKNEPLVLEHWVFHQQAMSLPVNHKWNHTYIIIFHVHMSWIELGRRNEKKPWERIEQTANGGSSATCRQSASRAVGFDRLSHSDSERSPREPILQKRRQQPSEHRHSFMKSKTRNEEWGWIT